MMAEKGHIFHPTILREYDIRGIVDQTLTLKDAEVLGRCYGSQVIRNGGDKIAVGYDGRLSSPALAAALITGLRSTGLNVIDIGCGPTPMVYFAVFELDCDGGVMVTGSHNSPEYNGFKLMLGKDSFYGDQIQALGRTGAAADYETGEGRYVSENMTSRYLDRLLKDVDFAALAARDLKVGWDPGNGAGGEVVRDLIKQLPGRHFLINGAIDGRFPAHHPDPTIPENLSQLAELIRDRTLDVGFAFDGDADRIGMMNKDGAIVWGDQMLAILAQDILQRHPGATIIGDVKTSQSTFDVVEEGGGKAIMWKSGHSLIKDKMRQTGALLAGEMSGHIYFGDPFYGYDDGIYAALRLLNVIAGPGRGLTGLLENLPRMVSTPEIRLVCPENRKFEIVRDIKRRLAATDCMINDVDGVRVTSARGWWLLRPSNTEGALVARCEGRTESDLDRLLDQLNEQLALAGAGPVLG